MKPFATIFPYLPDIFLTRLTLPILKLSTGCSTALINLLAYLVSILPSVHQDNNLLIW